MTETLDRPAVAAQELGPYASTPTDEVLRQLASGSAGLTSAEADRRRGVLGPNVVRTKRVHALDVLARQFRSAVLLLLLATAAAAAALGDRTEALIIGVILAASVGLGFTNEYRAERSAAALHASIRHRTTVLRDDRPQRVDVADLVPGDVITVRLGEVIPADLRLLETSGLECDESILTGESLPATKDPAPVPPGTPLAERASCALMGTVVRGGEGTGLVVGTGTSTEFGRIAAGLADKPPETEFQAGLRRFSMLLLQVATVLIVLIFAANVILRRPVLDALLFSLAIAVGVTPQLLPAVVSSSLANGSRRLASHRVLVKRLVCIEDLGELDVLVTDKTGTLTEGHIRFESALDGRGRSAPDVRRLGLLCANVDRDSENVVGGNALDVALWDGADDTLVDGWRRLATVPFDHDRARSSALVQHDDDPPLLVTKGAPENVLARCHRVPPQARQTLDAAFAAGLRVVAVATRPLPGRSSATVSDEAGLALAGFLTFLDPPKATATAALARLRELDIDVKIATGDNAAVAEKLCATVGLPVSGTLTGPQIDALDDAQLAAVIADTTIFGRVTPEQKARIVSALRGHGRAIGFLGDGVNDALALHAADVGISVDSAADVAKDAADIVLLEKSLDVLSDGVAEGRRIFANTIKYVLMGTSSNFGNMVSAAAASAVLTFLPMLPSQILLNNLLYDAGQLTIPTDHVDEEQVTRPSHWDIGAIRRFMLVFGPLSSIFDFVTFAVLLGPLGAGPQEFRTGWYVESLATQTLVIFAIRTRRVPFVRSRPSLPLVAAILLTVAVGASVPYTPFAAQLGFVALPVPFLLSVVAMVACYLVLVEVGKRRFYRTRGQASPAPPLRRQRVHRLHRRTAQLRAITREHS